MKSSFNPVSFAVTCRFHDAEKGNSMKFSPRKIPYVDLRNIPMHRHLPPFPPEVERSSSRNANAPVPMLSYCTNIHPAESWAETREALFTYVPLIRKELTILNSPLKDRSLGIGLRLSAKAARELLETPDAIDSLKSWLNAQNARVETLNGFPYGNFHGDRVKERVFQPDWTTPERFEYTYSLFRILALIGDERADRLTVSTLPASHSWFHADEERIFARLEAMSGFLDALGRQTGRLMQLGLEPEPFGHFHDTEGAIRFFNALRNRARRPELIERHIGLTYDTCHFSILREEPEYTLSAWEENNISLCKVQFSNALECRIRGEEDLVRLQEFDDGVYFHQTSIRHGEQTMLFPDLPNALAYARDYANETRNSIWRIHYHIPLYAAPEAPLNDTGSYISSTLDHLRRHPELNPHQEVETYTWSVLPDHMKIPLASQIARELNHVETFPCS